MEKTKKSSPWNKIKKILLSTDKLKFLNKISSIEFYLFTKEKLSDKDVIKIIYKNLNENLINLIPKECDFIPVEIIKPLDEISDDKLINFYFEKIDNTGNVQLWPSEEILSVYCLINQEIFQNKKVIELGSGFSGLSSLIIAKNIPGVNEICITDGNSKSVDSVKKNIELNFNNENNHITLTQKVLLWNRNFDNYELNDKNKFDFVLISDCLFFKNYHIDLINTIDYLLNNEGTCIIISPARGDTMDTFITLAQEKFKIIKSQSEISFINIIKVNSNSKFQPYYIQLNKK